MESIKCRNCETVFITNRHNQFYCNRKCQIQRNNNIARNKRNSRKFVTDILDKNNMILLSVLSGKDSITISREQLDKNGFIFNYITHQKRIQNLTYNIIYDIGISISQNNQCLIRKIS